MHGDPNLDWNKALDELTTVAPSLLVIGHAAADGARRYAAIAISSVLSAAVAAAVPYLLLIPRLDERVSGHETRLVRIYNDVETLKTKAARGEAEIERDKGEHRVMEAEQKAQVFRIADIERRLNKADHGR